MPLLQCKACGSRLSYFTIDAGQILCAGCDAILATVSPQEAAVRLIPQSNWDDPATRDKLLQPLKKQLGTL